MFPERLVSRLPVASSLSVAQGTSIAMRQIQSCSLELRMELPDDDGDALLAALHGQPPESDDDGDVAAAIQNAVQRAVPPAAGPDGPACLEDVAQHAKVGKGA